MNYDSNDDCFSFLMSGGNTQLHNDYSNLTCQFENGHDFSSTFECLDTPISDTEMLETITNFVVTINNTSTKLCTHILMYAFHK